MRSLMRLWTLSSSHSLQSCGNGILGTSAAVLFLLSLDGPLTFLLVAPTEAGEDCDPGSSTNSTCCDPQTCKFRSGAVCDPTNDLCCSSTCQVAGAGTVCRARTDEQCDVAETCDGASATCPADEFTTDGELVVGGRLTETGLSADWSL